MRTGERITRQDRKAQTRERLIATAHEVLLRRGFHAATLDEIAMQAGVTKGAVYSNFDSKADLFVAVVDARTEQRMLGYRRVRTTARGIEELAREHAKIMLRDDPDGRWSSVLAEAWAAAAADEGFRSALIERSRGVNRSIGEAIEEIGARGNVGFRYSTAEMTRMGGALMRGLLLQRLLDPDAMSKDLIEDTFVAFVRGMVRPRTGQPN